MSNAEAKEIKKGKAPEFIVFGITLEMKVFEKAVDEVALDSGSTAEEINEVMIATGEKLGEWHDKLEKVQQLIEGYEPPQRIRDAAEAASE